MIKSIKMQQIIHKHNNDVIVTLIQYQCLLISLGKVAT